jgi:hypothetical protein
LPPVPSFLRRSLTCAHQLLTMGGALISWPSNTDSRSDWIGPPAGLHKLLSPKPGGSRACRPFGIGQPTRAPIQSVLELVLDAGVSVLSQRSVVLWLLGFCEAALEDIDRALKDAREIGCPTLLDALVFTGTTHFLCGNYAEANDRRAEGGEAQERKLQRVSFSGCIKGRPSVPNPRHTRFDAFYCGKVPFSGSPRG